MKKLFYFLSLFLTFNGSSQCFSVGTGADGAYLATVNTTLAGGTYNFTSFTINPGVVVSVTGNSSLVIYCSGTATIDGVLSASGGNGSDGITYTSAGIGGIGVAGGGNGGNGTYSTSLSGMQASDGNNTGGVGTFGNSWSGGGGAGYATNGNGSGSTGGLGGAAYGTADLAGLWAGSGGGGGSGGISCGSGGGGAGGGLIIFNANSIIIGATGSIRSNGGNGGSDGNGNCGGGGAGSGGSIWLASPSLTNNGNISAIGGIGGASAVPGSPYYGAGGNGSAGRIRVDGALSGSGSITPILGYNLPQPALPSASTQTLNICNGETITVASSTYSASGTYQDIIPNAIGCDSTITTVLTVLPEQTSTQTLTLCAGETLSVGTDTYTTSGTYQNILTSIGGCDSTVTTNLTVLPAISSIQTLTVCAGESLSVGTDTYATSGSYQNILTSIGGCDSTVTTNLTVLPAISSIQTLTVCAGETLTVGTDTYATSGTYQNILTSIGGCDSTVTTNLTVSSPINTNVSINQSILVAAQVGAIYQWIDCNNGNTPISLATTQNFSPTSNGDYAVVVSVGNCSDTSDCIVYDLVGINEILVSTNVLYPNPTNGKCNIVYDGDVFMSLTITDASGRRIEAPLSFLQNIIEIDLSHEVSGLYFVNLQTETGIQLLKVSKN
ncbi:MAG: T9SS type A sorting domain-containing protein [Crocinitomicaceae bacterium]|nr:T9SS type A sorting domain-containing protein [Crocinitomicaceae bacterium]MCF8434631.1 T9SS type A sorting domain-containing protein [Crocinitomicaceae bacterium]